MGASARHLRRTPCIPSPNASASDEHVVAVRRRLQYGNTSESLDEIARDCDGTGGAHRELPTPAPGSELRVPSGNCGHRLRAGPPDGGRDGTIGRQPGPFYRSPPRVAATDRIEIFNGGGCLRVGVRRGSAADIEGVFQKV